MARLIRIRVAVAAMLAGLLSCADSTAPAEGDTRAPTDLRLLATPYGTPPLATSQLSFWAVKGRAAAVDIWFRAAPGRTDSTKYLEFRVGAGSLDRRPDGSAIATGDSVQITLTVTDARHFIVEFQPSGLVFSALDQPSLKLIYSACGEDLNYDGRVDDADRMLEGQLNIWRQEAPFQPWVRLSSVVTASSKEVNARLGGFTGYALMY